MNDSFISDLLVANEELLAAYENLSDAERSANELASVMNNIQGAVETISQLGLDPEIKAILNRDDALENLCNAPVNKITVEMAQEGLKEAVSEGAKRVWEGLKNVIAKIIEFFRKLFNTTNYQIEQILANPARINFDKVVNTSTKDKIGCIFKDCQLLNQLVTKYIDVPRVRYTSMQEDIAITLAKADLLKQDIQGGGGWNGYISLTPGLQFFEQMALKEAQFSLNDITGICWRFRDKAKSYTFIGEKLNALGNNLMTGIKADGIVGSGAYSRDRADVNDMLTGLVIVYRLDTSMYSILAKLQGILAKQINAFFKAMDDTAVTGVQEEKENSHANELPYTPGK